MYDDTLKVANKIITDTDLEEIFQKMEDDLNENIKTFNQEKIQNEMLDYGYQHWTVKSFDGAFKCTFDFYDDTNITVDNFGSFKTIFNNRIQEIKEMSVYYSYSYSIVDGKEQKYVSKRINMYIKENKMSIDVKLGSEDKKMEDVFLLIKEKILNAPERYDRVIKRKNAIMNKIGIALGMIPALVICTLLVFVPQIREVYGMTYVLYPIGVLILAYVIGNTICTGKVSGLYSSITPKKVYAGYDSSQKKSIYKDDIDDFVSTSEIIIGKNINNIRNRKEILELESKYSKFIPIELIVLLVLSIIMILVGKFL